MSERRGTKALELWCRRITDGYPGVSVQNMTTSWRDGLAFCAMIHHFRPDLIDFGSLNKDDIYRNNELAFRTAEQHLGIPALLDAEDMASCAVPDRLSILTYLSQFYQVFGGSSPSKLALSRSAESTSQRIAAVPESPQAKVGSRLGMRRESCASCGLPVFLAEKLVVARSCYHRSCFRCARCLQQLTPGNYYETEAGEFCCEACPDQAASLPPDLDDEARQQEPAVPGLLEAPLSDEEKSKSVDALLRSQRSKLDLMASHLLGEERPQSDEEKSARQQQQQTEPEKFDHMIKLISERIDELSSGEPPERSATEGESKSSPSTRGREQSAPPRADARRARSDDESEERRRRASSPVLPLRRSSSLRSEHTKDDAERPLSRSLSFVRRSLRFLKDDRRKKQQQQQQQSPSNPEKTAQDYPDELNPFGSEDEQPSPSTNPFGPSSEEEEEQAPPKPVARQRRSEDAPKKRLIEAPAINLNPFWSDDEEPAPVPRPRGLRHSLQPKSSLHSSNASIASSCSTTPGGTYRKKKPAPPPPPSTLSATSSANVSPRLTPRARKSKPAPPVPPTPSRPDNDTVQQQQQQQLLWDDEKLNKDEANRTTQSLSSSSCAQVPALYPLDKSVEGKWKRKKGPAPARPTPLRRKIKVMSMKDVKLELDQIEMQQQGLERQGVRLEQIIRDKCESGTVSEETSLGMDVEELVLELFALVNEKNELFRRQAELMLLRRQQRLEEEHADIEYQVRCLITQPEATKTDFDKQREETLIQRLVDIVQKRNEIVECLEMDRRREIEEDRSIHREMDLYAARSKTDTLNMTDESRRSSKLKKIKVKEKTKEKKSKKSNKKDADKDVDETEAKQKRHTLRKWF